MDNKEFKALIATTICAVEEKRAEARGCLNELSDQRTGRQMTGVDQEIERVTHALRILRSTQDRLMLLSEISLDDLE